MPNPTKAGMDIAVKTENMIKTKPEVKKIKESSGGLRGNSSTLPDASILKMFQCEGTGFMGNVWSVQREIGMIGCRGTILPPTSF